MALPSRPFGMPQGYDPYGDALPSYSTGVPSYMSLPAGGSGMSSPAPSSGGGFGLTDLIAPGASAAGNFLATLFGMKNANAQAQKNRQATADAQTNSLAQNTAQGTQAVASKESTLDPFRSRMSQVGDAAKLDRVANATSSPVRLNTSGPFSGFVPQVSGGYSYQKSPALVNAAKAAQTSVLSGTPDPSMTNPENYGKTGALDLLGVAAGTKNPASASAFATGAPSAGSSLGADPVSNMIRQGYQQKLGRPASDAEIQSVVGQLSKIYGRQLTAADSGLINAWIQKDLAGSPEAQQRPSYMGGA